MKENRILVKNDQFLNSKISKSWNRGARFRFYNPDYSWSKSKITKNRSYFWLFMSWLKKHFWADNRGKVSTGKVPFYKINIFSNLGPPLLAGYFVAKSNGQITPVFITRDGNTWSDSFIWSKRAKTGKG